MITLTYEECAVILPNPIFGNDQIHTTRRIRERSRKGTRWIKNPGYGTSVDTLTYTIDGVTGEESSEVMALYRASLGKDITLTDYNGVDWLVTILQQPRIEHVSPDSCQPFRLTLTFEGSQI